MRKFRDQLFVRFDELTEELIWEHKRQVEKWGTQNHELPAWLMFLTEEVGELSEAIAEQQYREGTFDAIKAEAIQVATLALKIAEIAENEIESDGMPRMRCPRCRRVYVDYDGLGVLHCEACGYCQHPSAQANDEGRYICDLCGKDVS